MSNKKIFLVIAIIFSIYGFITYIYFSTKPALSDYCPITMPGESSLVLDDPMDPNHRFKTINDTSCLNQTRVYDIVVVHTIDDIRQALKLAKEKKLHISIAGVRHSMGGQAFYKDALVLDMREFNHIIALDENNKILNVESGATWHQIQLYLHSKNLAVKSMQSTDIFTVGGSLSVNAHGMDHLIGSMASTIRSFTIMLADGSIQKITPIQSELFNAAIGGYGLFGVVLSMELEITDNVMYQRDIIFLDYREFPKFFEKIMQEKTYGLFYAHLSTSPLTFFKDMIVYGYKKIEHTGSFEPLGTISLVNLRRFLINLSKRRSYAQILKWVAEKYIDPTIDARLKKNIISRNEIMHDSVEYLQNVLVDETDILQEYFIPRKHFVACIEQLGVILKKSKIPVLNASIRIVHKESTMLNYAPEDMFSIVLYLNQRVTSQALKSMENLTQDLIDLVLKFNGTFFLPYQLSFTSKQLHAAYPNIDSFFKLKRKYDPNLIFMNHFYARYATEGY